MWGHYICKLMVVNIITGLWAPVNHWVFDVCARTLQDGAFIQCHIATVDHPLTHNTESDNRHADPPLRIVGYLKIWAYIYQHVVHCLCCPSLYFTVCLHDHGIVCTTDSVSTHSFPQKSLTFPCICRIKCNTLLLHCALGPCMHSTQPQHLRAHKRAENVANKRKGLKLTLSTILSFGFPPQCRPSNQIYTYLDNYCCYRWLKKLLHSVIFLLFLKKI